MSLPGRVRIAEPSTGNEGHKESVCLNLGRLMIVLGLVNPPFWASIVRGITIDVVVAGAVFSGLMIGLGVPLTLIGRSRIARNTRNASGQETRLGDRRP